MATSGQAPAYSTPSQFFVTGGTMRLTAPSYVERDADAQLYRSLSRSEFCYLLDTRQMGKSSMMARAAKRLREEGSAVAIVDLQNLGQSLTIDQWYYAQLSRIGDALNLEDEVDEFWAQDEKAPPLNRWVRTIQQVILPAVRTPLTIFIDEIDFVRSLPFPTDEFFAAIRGFHNGRAVHADLNRLTFCLLGVATPTDLIRSEELTPFNVGRRIDLADFSEAEVVDGFAAGLNRPPAIAREILKRVWYWTEGHPYLTQKLAEASAEDAAVVSASGVDRVCRSLFLASGSREQNDNLRFVANRMLAPDVEAAGVLDLYRKVREGETVLDDGTNPLVNVLRLSGVARVVEGRLRVRNPIYVSVFDDAWIERNMPDQELVRQREVYRKARLRTALVVSAVAALIGIALYAGALQVRNRELDKKNKQIYLETQRAQAAETEARKQAAVADSERQMAVDAANRAHAAEDRATQEAAIAEQRRQQAEKASVAAVRAEMRALASAADAQKQRTIALDAVHEANMARMRAEESEKQLTALTKKLAEDSKTASTLRLASRSEAERSQSSSSIEPSVLLAIESLGRMWSVENYPTLLQGMTLTPRHEGLRAWEHRMGKTLYPSANGAVLAGIPQGSTNQLCLWRLAGPTENCTALPGRDYKYVPSNDGRYVWAISAAGVQYWDTTGNTGWMPVALPEGSHFFVPSPDGTMFASTDNKEMVVVRSFPDAKPLLSIQGRRGAKSGGARELHPIQFAADNRHLLLYEPGAGGGAYQLWDIPNRREMFEMSARTDPVLGPDAESAFEPHAGELTKPEVPLALKLLRDRVARGRPLFPSFLRLFSRSPDNGPLKTKTLASVPTIRTYSYSPDGKLFAAATPDSVVVWQVGSGAQVPLSQTDNVTDLAFSPDSQMLAVWSRAHDTARVFDTRTYQELARVLHPGISSAAFNKEGWLVTASPDRAEVWQSKGWQAVATLGRSPQPARTVLFSGTNDAAAFFSGVADSAGADNTLSIRDASSGRVIRRLMGGIAFSRPQFSADGKRLAVLTGDALVLVFDAATGREAGRIVLPDSYVFERFSPDGERVLAVRNGRYMKIVDLRGETVDVDAGLRGSTFFFPDAGKIAVIGADGIHSWSVSGKKAGSWSVRSPVRLAVAENGRYAVAMTRRGTGLMLESWLWDSGGPKLTRLPWPEENYTALRFSPTGEFVAVAGPKGWSIHRLPGGETVYNLGPARNVFFRADGKMIAAQLPDTIAAIDAAHSRILGSIPSEPGRVVVGFSSDGNVATQSGKKFDLWNPVTGERKTVAETRQAIRTALIASDGRFAAIVEASPVTRTNAPDDLRVTDLKTATTASFRFPSTVTAAAFSDDGKYLAGASLDGTVRIIERSSQKDISAPPHEIEATSIAIAPGSRYAASSGGQTVRLWPVTDPAKAVSRDFPDRVLSVAFVPDGTLLAAGCGDGVVRLLKVPELTEQRSLNVGQDIRSVMFSPNGKLMASLGQISVKLFDTGSWKQVATWEQAGLAGGVFGPASSHFAAYDGNGFVRLWGVRDALVLELPKFDSPLTGAAFGADETRLLVGASGGVRIVDLGRMEEIGRVPAAGKVAAIGISPDGRYLGISNSNGTGAITYWQPRDLIAQACTLLTRKSLTGDEKKKYLLAGESYEDFCIHPEKIVP